MTGETIEQHFCRDCGASIPANRVLCNDCLKTHMPKADNTSMPCKKSRVAAALLALFLGDFGAHKFYLGRPKLGFIYLALSWTLMPLIFATIEGFIILYMSDEEFKTAYAETA